MQVIVLYFLHLDQIEGKTNSQSYEYSSHHLETAIFDEVTHFQYLHL